MVSLKYYLKFKNEDWSEVGALVQSSNTSPFNMNLCSTAWMSTINTASFTLKYTGTTLYHQIVDKLISAQSFRDDVQCRITDIDGNVLFYGILDLNKLELTSAKIPLSLSISANDHMKKLDNKVGKNAIFKVGRKMMDVVAWMMEDAGLPPVSVWADGSDSVLLETPVVFTEDSDDKYLDVVNKLLQELGGYTMVSDPTTQTFHVRKVGRKSDSGNIPTVSYMVSSRLKSGSSLFSNDGVVVKYRNVKESGQELVYMQNISIKDEPLLDPDGKYDTNGNRLPNSKDGTKAIPLGDVVGVGGYFPLDSDVTKTYQEYDSSLFDYSLQQKKTRKANSELGIYYVDPTTIEVKMIASDKDGNSLKSTWYENIGFHSKEGGFDYPTGGEFHPKKAWQIFRNKLDECVNVKSLIIEGKAVFSDREYSLVMPMSARDPYEYASSYISTRDTALNLSALLTNVKKHGGDTSSWTAPWGAYALGQEVYVEHPSASRVRAIIVKKTMKVIGGQLWCDYVAVHNGSWEEAREYAFSGDSQSTPSYDPYVQAVANGYEGSRTEYEAERQPLVQYAVIPSADNFGEGIEYGDGEGEYGFSADETFGSEYHWTAGQIDHEALNVGEYIWMRTSTDGGSTWVYTRLMGREARVFDISITSQTFVRDLRSTDENRIPVTVTLEGYDGIYSISTDPEGLYDERTRELVIPYSTSASKVRITATLPGIGTRESVLNAIDRTEYNRYLGHSPSAINVEGDFYFDANGTKKLLYFNGTSWVPMSQSGLSEAQRSEILAKAQADILNTIPADSVTESDYAFFNRIIAGEIDSDYLSTKDIDLKKGGSIMSDTVKIGGYPGWFGISWTKSMFSGVSALISLIKNIAPGFRNNIYEGTVTANGTTIGNKGKFSFGDDLLSCKFVDNDGGSIEFFVNGYYYIDTWQNGVSINGGENERISSAEVNVMNDETVTKLWANNLSPWQRFGTEPDSSIGTPGTPYAYGFIDKLYANEVIIDPFSGNFPNAKYDNDEGSVRLPFGMILKWKNIGSTGSGSGTYTWNFMDPFPTACVFAIGSPDSGGSLSMVGSGWATSYSEESVTFSIVRSLPHHFIAIGY